MAWGNDIIMFYYWKHKELSRAIYEGMEMTEKENKLIEALKDEDKLKRILILVQSYQSLPLRPQERSDKTL